MFTQKKKKKIEDVDPNDHDCPKHDTIQNDLRKQLTRDPTQTAGSHAQFSDMDTGHGYRPIAHDVTAPVTMHLEEKLAIYE